MRKRSGWDTGPVSDQAEGRYPSAVVDGFELRMFVSYDECGDAWVKAPDGRIASLVWETGDPSYFRVVLEPDARRWVTYAVQLPVPLTNDEQAARYLAALLPELRPRWEATSGE